MIRDDLASRWYKAVFFRHSVRAYDGTPIPQNIQHELKQLLDGFSPLCEGARAVLLKEGSSDIFPGFPGPFSRMRRANLVLVLIGDTCCPGYETAVGFLGEGIILHATSLGLGTCWVSGTYRRKAVEERVRLGEYEKVMAVSPLGFASGRRTIGDRHGTRENTIGTPGIPHKRKPIKSLVRGLPMSDWPPGYREILEAARLAPSAVNRQPWRFAVSSDRIVVSAARFELLPMSARKLDCGISMLHIEVASSANGINGEWKLLDKPPGIAEFIIGKKP